MSIFIIVLYSKFKEQEKIPNFLKNSKRECFCDNAVVILKSVQELKESDRKLFWNKIRVSISKKSSYLKDIYLFIHDVSSLKKDDINELNPKIIIDYSSTDPFYEDMWEDIKNSKNCDELANNLKYWMEFYTVEPIKTIKRLKHRFINSFQSLSIDLARLIELINENDIAGLKEHLKYLSEYWKERNEGPLNKLVNFWYALVGERGLKWGESYRPKKPGIILPKDEKGKEVTIYYQLEKIFGAEKTKKMLKWIKLLLHCQLYQICNGNFEIRKQSKGIYVIAKDLEDLIIFDGPDKEKLKMRSEYYIKWLNKLNELIEQLIQI